MKLKLIDFGSGAFYQSGPFTDFDGKLHFIPAYCRFYMHIMQLRFWPSFEQLRNRRFSVLFLKKKKLFICDATNEKKVLFDGFLLW